MLDLFCPAWLTSDVASAPATAYLGVVLLGATVWGARRWDGARPWVMGSVTMALLALGPFWVFHGQVLEIGSWTPPTLASVFEQVPVLDRISRWYCAGAVAILLMIPFAIRAIPDVGSVGWLRSADAFWVHPYQFSGPIRRCPVGWHRARSVGGDSLSIPCFLRKSAHRPERVVNWNHQQMRHGQPISGTQNQVPLGNDVHGPLLTLENELTSPNPHPPSVRSAQLQLYAQGYRNLVFPKDSNIRPPMNRSWVLHKAGEDLRLFALAEP